MSAPRFQKGQVVVVRWDSDSRVKGRLFQVADMAWRTSLVTAKHPAGWMGWVYYEAGDPIPHCEYTLAPYDPPSTWDHEDSVFKPEELKKRETVT